MVEEDDAAEILGRASYAGFSPEAGASAIAATNIVLDRGQIREEIRSGCHQRYFRACRARGLVVALMVRAINTSSVCKRGFLLPKYPVFSR